MIQNTKRKHLIIKDGNLDALKDQEADVLFVTSLGLKQVTVTFSFPTKEDAAKFFAKFQENTGDQ